MSVNIEKLHFLNTGFITYFLNIYKYYKTKFLKSGTLIKMSNLKFEVFFSILIKLTLSLQILKYSNRQNPKAYLNYTLRSQLLN